MAEKRSIPAALGIFIGPAIAYTSFLAHISGWSEYTQFIFFAMFVLAAYDLAKCGLSLSGTLTVLLLPALPIALYLKQSAALASGHLSPVIIVSFWVASALLGAVLAGLGSPDDCRSTSVRRLVSVAAAMLILLVVNLAL